MLSDIRPFIPPTLTPSKTTSLFPSHFELQQKPVSSSHTSMHDTLMGSIANVEKRGNELEIKLISSKVVNDMDSTVSDIGDTHGIALSSRGRSNVIPEDRPVTLAQSLTNRDDGSSVPLGSTPVVDVPHEIRLKEGSIPVRQASRRHLYLSKNEEIIRKKAEAYLRLGIWRKCNVPLVYTGWDSSLRAKGDAHVDHHLKYMHSYMLMNTVGINLNRLRDGICGSPIVIDSYGLDPEDQGDVLGFFAYTDQNVV